jgi:hypothetical protein
VEVEDLLVQAVLVDGRVEEDQHDCRAEEAGRQDGKGRERIIP